MFYLTMHSTHFIYGYMASDIWLRTILIVRKETRCRHIGYSYRLTARVLLYVPSHREDNTYHGLCYTSRGALAGTLCHQVLFTSILDETNRTICNSIGSRHRIDKPNPFRQLNWVLLQLKNEIICISVFVSQSYKWSNI